MSTTLQKPPGSIDVLPPGGWIGLINHTGGDLSAVNAARVSLARESHELDDDDRGLIRFLMKNRHMSPFEHNQFTFLVRCPIFVAREWRTHRIGSFNEISARYTKLETNFYLPETEDVRIQIGKPGAYTFQPVGTEIATRSQEIMQTAYETCEKAYLALLDLKVAKELARTVLPVGTYTAFYWTVNARALMNFLVLRNAPDAQLEIRRYGAALEDLFQKEMPETHMAFLTNGRRV